MIFFSYYLVRSFIELTRTLLAEGGAKFLLSEKFSQDPLEEHFGTHRRSGGANENPTYYQFQKQEVSLNVMKSDLIHDIKGNTCGRNKNKQTLDINDMRRLPYKKNTKK